MGMLLVLTPYMTLAQACMEDPLWDNHSGRRCADYAREGWCRNGALASSFLWTGGVQFK